MAEEEKQQTSGESQKVDRFKGLPPAIAEEIKGYENSAFKEDKPISFGKLTIYPVTVHDYELFFTVSSCLTFNKNETPEGLRMTSIDYIYNKLNDPQEGKIWSYKLHSLLELVFHIKNGIRCKKCGEVIQYSDPAFLEYASNMQKLIVGLKDQQNQKLELQNIPKLKCPHCQNDDMKEFNEIIKFVVNDKKHVDLYVDGQLINSNDFNRLKNIVLFQNILDYRDDSWVDPDIKKDYEQRMEIEAKQSGHPTASLERKIVGLSIATNYKFSEIYDMTIRKFTLALGLVDDLINYKIMRSAQMSGFVSFPKGYKLEHWLYKTEKDMYGENYKSTDDVMNEHDQLG